MSDFYTKLGVEDIIYQLFQICKFYNERRLVYEFSKILEQKGFRIFLEYPNKKGYEDIRVETPFGVFIFEFKYCPSAIEVAHGCLKKKTRSRSPVSKRVKNFIQDIKRTENTVKNDKIAGGFCIFITNQTNMINALKKIQDCRKIREEDGLMVFINIISKT